MSTWVAGRARSHPPPSPPGCTHERSLPCGSWATLVALRFGVYGIKGQAGRGRAWQDRPTALPSGPHWLIPQVCCSCPGQGQPHVPCAKPWGHSTHPCSPPDAVWLLHKPLRCGALPRAGACPRHLAGPGQEKVPGQGRPHRVLRDRGGLRTPSPASVAPVRAPRPVSEAPGSEQKSGLWETCRPRPLGHESCPVSPADLAGRGSPEWPSSGSMAEPISWQRDTNGRRIKRPRPILIWTATVARTGRAGCGQRP